MYARFTHIKFLPEHEETARKLFREEVIPEVKKQKGIIDIKLMIPSDKADDYISVTEWEKKEDADAYAASGVYQKLVDKLKELYTKKPVLKTYSYDSATILTATH
ncbi:MAG TPA: antibiotic biosynthesis monooxygenase [Flavisolibacter sp.]|nr:antibiotic biosynthesis monooxygenase [Flavisolibacter sp.]